MTHKDEIIRWANCPDDTKVWYRRAESMWDIVVTPLWLFDVDYIVDDKYAELRKAQADGKTILFLGEEADNLSFNNELENYSIKKDFAHVLKRSVHTGKIVCFISEIEGIVVDDNDWVEYDVGDKLENLVPYDNRDHWEDVK